MPAVRPLWPAPEWDGRFTRMCGVSAVAHGLVIAAVLLLSGRGGFKPLPLVAYTVEITDPNALGGRLPPGAPGRDLTGGPEHAAPPAPKPAPAPAPEAGPPAPPEPKPEAKAEPAPEPPKPPEPKPVEAKAPEPKIEAKPVVPKPPEPKPVPKPEPPRPAEAKPAEPKPEAKRPEPAKAEPPKAESKPHASPPEAAAPAKPAASPGAAAGHEAATPEAPPVKDAYGAAAERWRARAGSGGGLGGADGGTGPIGMGGEGKGGGGQLVGLEYLAYLQQVNNTVKTRWTTVITRPGLVASVLFEIAPDGTVSNIRLEQSSGNPAYDSSALRAVQLASPLPPPPARYQKEFSEFRMRFNSDERHGQEG